MQLFMFNKIYGANLIIKNILITITWVYTKYSIIFVQRNSKYKKGSRGRGAVII